MKSFLLAALAAIVLLVVLGAIGALSGWEVLIVLAVSVALGIWHYRRLRPAK